MTSTRALRSGAAGALGALVLLGACQTADPRSPSGAGTRDTATGTTTTAHTTTRASTPSPSTPAMPPSPTASLAELPRGGRALFPRYRLVGYAGAPGSPALGRLGVGYLDDRVRELESRAAAFGAGREAQPVLELITTVVQGSPGRDGKWRTRLSDKAIRQHLDTARRHRAILLLGIQPGRASFLDEIKAHERWLRQPDVGLALDPEWAMKPGQVPMRVFGHTTGREINEVTAWVATLVTRHQLPEKAVVVHELAPNIVRGEEVIRARQGVALIKSVDGIGDRAMKEETWRKLTTSLPKGMRVGFKLFYEEDREFGPLMTPAQVLALEPTVDYVLYE